MNPIVLLASLLLLSYATGCRDQQDSHGHSHNGADAHSHGNDGDHAPPHGGTPVVIADDVFHLELVLDTSTPKMQAYVLDGHLEKYVEVMETNFVLHAKSGAITEQLSFLRLPAETSGNLASKSSLFEAKAVWLKNVKEFDGHIPVIALGGKSFTNISFSFPKGTKHVH